MSKKIRRPVSILTSITTAVWLSGVAMLAPMAVGAAIVDGDIVSPDAEFTEGDITYYPYDVFIVKIVGSKTFKRLILNPEVFESYGHLEWGNIQTISADTVDGYTTSDLVRELNDTKVYKLTPDGDVGTKGWVNMTAAEFESEGYDWDSIYVINVTDRDNYTTGSDVVVGGEVVVSEGTLTATLAADTPAASIAVQSAARLAFTKVNLTASGGDVIVDTLVVERVGLANDSNFSSLDIIDAGTSLPLNNTSKTFNSLHQATFTDDFTVANGTTKSIILAGNMAASLSSYAGEVPALALSGITLKGDATTNASLPITGNTMTINATITIGSATIQRGAYTNATSSSIQVGKEDYTFFSFQVAAGSVEKVEFSQIKVYQEGSASLGSDVINLELLQDGTKIADGVVASSKYVNFSFDTITLDKGQTAQFQVKADINDGSARTVNLGIYKTTDLLVKGVTYGYNITPTYSSTGASAGNPVLSDNEFTISNGTLQVTRSNTIGAGNISVGNDQYLGAFSFECKGEPISVSAITLTVTSGGGTAQIEDALTGAELVDPNGNVVAGPTDITNGALTVSWSDTFTVPVGTTIYKIRADLSTNGGWASNDTIYVSLTPGDFTATGDVTGNAITPTPSSALDSNTQTVKAASLTVTRNTLPADANIILNQNDLVLSSWNFDATASGEDIRITSVLWAAKGWASTNTNALTTFIDENENGIWDEDTDTVLSPVNDALSSAATIAAASVSSTFAFTDPIIITKGTAVHVVLKGDKDTVASNATENWGLGDGTASVIAYGLTTGNTVTESITNDNGPTLTSKAKGTITIETINNPSSAIVIAGSSGNVFTNIKLTTKYEDANVNNLVVHVGDGSYEFNADDGEYRDVGTVYLYDGTDLLGSASIPSTGYYTFEFEVGDLVITKGATNSKTLTIKADMSTIDPDADNAPGTASADLKIGIGGTDGIKATGVASNSEMTGSDFEDYRSSTSSAMVLRASKPTVTLPTSSNSLGAATSLDNGDVTVFAFKITADAAGGEILFFRSTFVFATSGSGMSVTDVQVIDQNNNIIGTASTPSSYSINDNYEYWDTFTFDSPDFSNGDDQEAIVIPAGESRTFKVNATLAGVSTGETFSTFLAGDTASTSALVNTDNFALSTTTENGSDGNLGWRAPLADLSGINTSTANFLWSDNYKQMSVSGSNGDNATTGYQWYNGHLVPGLLNKVSTTKYTIGN